MLPLLFCYFDSYCYHFLSHFFPWTHKDTTNTIIISAPIAYSTAAPLNYIAYCVIASTTAATSTATPTTSSIVPPTALQKSPLIKFLTALFHSSSYLIYLFFFLINLEHISLLFFSFLFYYFIALHGYLSSLLPPLFIIASPACLSLHFYIFHSPGEGFHHRPSLLLSQPFLG